MEPLLSVIVPVYKVEAYLRPCVDSILAQTYQNLEIILVDDGSPDNCGAICDEYAKLDSRIQVIHKENGGLSDARNTGLRAASGEYITFVDSDDAIHQNLYENAMARAPFSVIVFGCTDVYVETGNIKTNNVTSEKKTLSWSKDDREFYNLFKQSLLGYVCNKIYHRSILEQKYFTNVRLREDLLFNIGVFSQTTEIAVLNQPGYLYNHHEFSILTGHYHGDVPDITAVAEQMRLVHPLLQKSTNRRIANQLMKAYIADAMHKFIFLNDFLTDDQKAEAVRNVLQSKPIRKALRFYPGEGMLFLLLTVGYKLRCSKLLYRVLRGIWKT